MHFHSNISLLLKCIRRCLVSYCNWHNWKNQSLFGKSLTDTYYKYMLYSQDKIQVDMEMYTHCHSHHNYISHHNFSHPTHALAMLPSVLRLLLHPSICDSIVLFYHPLLNYFSSHCHLKLKSSNPMIFICNPRRYSHLHLHHPLGFHSSHPRWYCSW